VPLSRAQLMDVPGGPGVVGAVKAGTGIDISPDGTISLQGGSVGVTSVGVSGGSTGLTFSDSPITSTGTMTMSGILSVANGGTGTNTQAGAANSILPDQGGQGGKYLTTDGSNVSWGTVTAGVSSITAGAGLQGGGTGAVSIAMAPSGVAPGSYVNTNITVDIYGRVIEAANGAPPPAPPGNASFTSPGSWTAPVGVSRVFVSMIGGGGGGGGDGCCNTAGAGGGGGQIYSYEVPVSAGSTYPVEVGGGAGAGGPFNPGGRAGGTGGTSSVLGVSVGGGGGGQGGGCGAGGGGSPNGSPGGCGNGGGGAGGTGNLAGYGYGGGGSNGGHNGGIPGAPGFVYISW
jgi:hypothetical protein